MIGVSGKRGRHASEEWNCEDPERETEVAAGWEGSDVIASKVRQKPDGRHGERDCGDKAKEQLVVSPAQTTIAYRGCCAHAPDPWSRMLALLED